MDTSRYFAAWLLGTVAGLPVPALHSSLAQSNCINLPVKRFT